MPKNQILFCENRNQFFETERNGMTIWTTNNEKAERFNVDDAKSKIEYLQESIIDAQFILSVDFTSETY